MRNRDKLIQVGDLLDICQGCEFNIPEYDETTNRLNIVLPECHACDTYKKMRALGKELEGKINKKGRLPAMVMDIEEYKKLRIQGLTDKSIAEEKKVHPSTIRTWKAKRKDILKAEGVYKI